MSLTSIFRKNKASTRPMRAQAVNGKDLQVQALKKAARRNLQDKHAMSTYAASVRLMQSRYL